MSPSPRACKKTEDHISEPETTYDQVPYKGMTYPLSHPRHLSVVGRLFGLNPPAPEKARILEIGCACGGNLIPMAMAAPRCTCLGIDLSRRQIEEGRRTIAELGIDNVILENMSVADIPPNLGPFDYILCHGVFSWVPSEVQEHILRVCSENLAPNGLAYISYNTLPGWNSVKSIRDMMLYHTAQFGDPGVKVSEAVKMMRFVVNGLKKEDNLWRRTIEQELASIENMESWYIYHDHLENENHPLYFNDFMTMAQNKGLRYVGDSQLSTMYVGAMAKPVADTLSQLTDIIRQEQYMDFVRNRRFRMTVLAPAAQKPVFTVTPEKIAEFHIAPGTLKPDFDLTSQDWSKNEIRSFNGKTITTNNRHMACLLAILCEQPSRLVTVDRLVKEAAQRLGPKTAPAIRTAWNEYALQLCFLGYIALYDGPYADVATISPKPEVMAFARHQAKSGNVVINARHESIRLDKATQTLVPLVDGTRTLEELAEAFADRLQEVGANFLEGGIPTADPKRRLAIALDQAKASLDICCANKLLVK